MKRYKEIQNRPHIALGEPRKRTRGGRLIWVLQAPASGGSGHMRESASHRYLSVHESDVRMPGIGVQEFLLVSRRRDE